LPKKYNQNLLDMLFTFGLWHGLVKLRLHTEHTLNLLDETTTALGDVLRVFLQDTCADIPAKELPREYNARIRREARAKNLKDKSAKDKSVKDKKEVEPQAPERKNQKGRKQDSKGKAKAVEAQPETAKVPQEGTATGRVDHLRGGISFRG
jgi:hypothetical protein